MKILITGGGGFLGAKLARTLLDRGYLTDADGRKEISYLVIADQVAPPHEVSANPHVQSLVGTLLSQVDALKAHTFDAVFHLASAVSAECELDFDLGLRSNLDSSRALLDMLRVQFQQTGVKPRLVFASSGAVFGNDPAYPMPKVVTDYTLPTPQSSYGTHKFMLEQLIADYSRKGFIEGRSARLMTVCVRPGKPNGAASGFFSSIIREPVAGLEAVCPVPLNTRVALASPNTTIAGLIAVFEASAEQFGGRIALNMPALCLSVGEMLEALKRVCGDAVHARVRYERDALTEKMVMGWTGDYDNPRARAMGLPFDDGFDAIIAQHLDAMA